MLDAELDARYKPPQKADYSVTVAKAEAAYDIAKEKCADKAGNEKDVCVKEAKAAKVRAKADANAAVVFEAEKDVVLELVEVADAGWVKVRHRDGQSGFVRANQVWGL